jgi:hypothetical protein
MIQITLGYSLPLASAGPAGKASLVGPVARTGGKMPVEAAGAMTNATGIHHPALGSLVAIVSAKGFRTARCLAGWGRGHLHRGTAREAGEGKHEKHFSHVGSRLRKPVLT